MVAVLIGEVALTEGVDLQAEDFAVVLDVEAIVGEKIVDSFHGVLLSVCGGVVLDIRWGRD